MPSMLTMSWQSFSRSKFEHMVIFINIIIEFEKYMSFIFSDLKQCSVSPCPTSGSSSRSVFAVKCPSFGISLPAPFWQEPGATPSSFLQRKVYSPGASFTSVFRITFVLCDSQVSFTTYFQTPQTCASSSLSYFGATFSEFTISE